ncbi:protein phosphatase 1 regulatory subunit 36 isoform X1 [Mugil cephalus]|uniref:protein phosphatase 1 regulatory subunit 36 isoform X1 n=1 Tax=Mugil cephalus TaxID=48193 RepID=UPI001FB6B6A4|nr:protein phosphatase 1 regulatory subunit 36 isoform X1 [Mugil cephalus]
MTKYPKDIKNVSALPSGRWVWNNESQTVEFVRSCPTEEGVLGKKNQTYVDINELQQRAQWLAEVCTLNHRGRQSTIKNLRPAHLNEYRSSVMSRQGDRVTIDDVKQVAVSLLQENYLLPIPYCFLDVLRCKELDEVLTALLLYLSFFFEHKSLENKTASSGFVDIITEHKMMAETSAKKEIAQKKLAVCYFSLLMDLGREQRPTYQKRQVSSDRTEWLLHACLYSFFCYAAWVTFGRKDLRDVQQEVGRLLYSDAFNAAVRSATEGDARTMGAADHRETGNKNAFRQRASRGRPALGSAVNQRSPLMVSLLPSPKERSPHLFPGARAGSRSPPEAQRRDAEALAERLHRQLAGVSFGILGEPLVQFSRSTLMPRGEESSNTGEDEDGEEGGDVKGKSAEPSGIKYVQASKSSFVGTKSKGLARYASAAHTNAKSSAASTDLTS